ncbi:hypothetical protein BP5796_09782 [Coleophoma crateriformis]|uniref:Uncharacterized protein n=1 Tax=Coleophoma crateriformis TaxID=565419 RepID=A0A3D8QYX5_9HELO|nr:hypothetical protein BP5796_09782 [Coleophoma crateriformis]
MATETAPDDDLPSFDIDMFPIGDDSAFRTQNDPSAPYQRSDVIKRKGAVDIRCNCVDIVHGKFDSSAYATLLVLQFRFDPRKRARRIASAHITLAFSGTTPDKPRPEVYAISLDGSFHMAQTSEHQEVVKGGEARLGTSIIPGVSVDGGFKWEKMTSACVTDTTRVVGSIDRIGYNYGPDNCVSWDLLENETRKTGVPALMRAGVLLKRKNNDTFKCTVKIKAEADFRSNLETIFGSTPKVDPILFDPTMPPTNRLMKYNTENMEDLDLGSVSDVTFMNVLDGTMKNT